MSELASKYGILEEVEGIVIGGEFICWQLFYDGRSQGRIENADNDAQAIDAAKAEMNKLIEKFAGFPCYLYPDKSKWEVRIW